MPAGVKLADPLSAAQLAESRGVRECLQWFTREKQWINERHLELCRIPAPTFLEGPRAAWMAEQFRKLGYAAEIDPAGNVIALSPREPGGPLVALTAHLDTVLAPRTREDIAVSPDGTFYGPGVADNGAGLAALLAIARALQSCPPIEGTHSTILFAANIGEEGEGNLSGMRYLAKQSPLAPRIRVYAVLDGPSVDHITWQALASRRFEIAFTGPGGHSWSDYGTANPVHALSQAVAWFADQYAGIQEGEGPRSSFNFGLIEGGASVNSIPASARAKVDLRSESNARIGEMVESLNAAMERARDLENRRSTGGKLAAKWKEIGARPGGTLPEDAPILEFVRAVDAHLGIRARLDCASTDANIPLSLGIPALSIGAGGQGGGAHTASEWFHPEGRDLGLRRILLTLAFLLKEDLGR
jgi:acetylornithine deacetylase/succinyl-diaminopimelate desuccinylase-like protein